MGENCGGGEVWLWDVESERDEVIVGEDNKADDAVVESRDEIGVGGTRGICAQAGLTI